MSGKLSTIDSDPFVHLMCRLIRQGSYVDLTLFYNTFFCRSRYEGSGLDAALIGVTQDAQMLGKAMDDSDLLYVMNGSFPFEWRAVADYLSTFTDRIVYGGTCKPGMDDYGYIPIRGKIAPLSERVPQHKQTPRTGRTPMSEISSARLEVLRQKHARALKEEGVND